MRGSHTQAQGAAGQEAPLWVLGPREGSNLPGDPCVTPGSSSYLLSHLLFLFGCLILL